jgi:FAD-binding domain/Ferric reductase NAD binding domain
LDWSFLAHIASEALLESSTVYNLFKKPQHHFHSFLHSFIHSSIHHDDHRRFVCSPPTPTRINTFTFTFSPLTLARPASPMADHIIFAESASNPDDMANNDYDPVPIRHPADVDDHDHDIDEDHDHDDATDGIHKTRSIVGGRRRKLHALGVWIATHAVTRYLRRGQWQLRALFHRRIFHGRIIGIGGSGGCCCYHVITYGHVVLLLPLLVFITASIYLTLWHKNTGQTGHYAFYAILYTFWLAQKQQPAPAPSQLLLQLLHGGRSWEQRVSFHAAAAVTSLLLAVLHAYVAYTGHDYRPCREILSVDDSNSNSLPSSSQLLLSKDLMPLCRASPQVVVQHQPQHHHQLSELRLADNPRFRHSMIGLDPNLYQFLGDGPRNSSGTRMLLCLVLLISLSIFRGTLRQRYYELWLLSHIAAAGAFVAYASKHRIQLFLLIVVMWAVDGLSRYGWGSLYRLPKTATLTLLSAAPLRPRRPRREDGIADDDHDHAQEEDDEEDDDEGDRPTGGDSKQDSCSDVVELSFGAKFHYTAGQYVRIAVLETGQPIMFHPVSISSAPYEDNITVHFRPVGGWTCQLAQLAAVRHGGSSSNNRNNKYSSLTGKEDSSSSSSSSSRQNGSNGNNSSSSTTVHVLLEGPYGCLSMNLWEDPFRYPVVVLIAGGIGVTPISSISRQLLYEHNAVRGGGRERQQIRVVWAVRDVALVEALPLLGRRPDKVVVVPSSTAAEGEESGESASTVMMVDPFRQLQRNKGRDGLIREHYPPPLFFHEPNGGNDGDDHHHGGTTPPPPALFAASIYVTRPHKQNRPRNSTDGTDRAGGGSRHGPGSRNQQRNAHGDVDDEIELGQIGGPDLDDNNNDDDDDAAKSSTDRHNDGEHDDRFSYFTGRPDIQAILKATVTSSMFRPGQRMAVIACGPPGLVQEAQEACAVLSTSGSVLLDFHQEVFVL